MTRTHSRLAAVFILFVLLIPARANARKAPCHTFNTENLVYAAQKSAKEASEAMTVHEKIRFATQGIHWIELCVDSFPLETACRSEKALESIHETSDSLSKEESLGWHDKQLLKVFQKQLAKLEKKLKKAS